MLTVLLGYLAGSVPFAFLLARRAGIDVRVAGSGNVGAANVLRTTGTGRAVTVMALDVAKGARLETSARSKGLDMIFFAAHAPRDLSRLEAIAGRLEPAGAIWLIRAKGRGAPISERQSMAAGKKAGLVDVKVVSYSDTHSAEKYVIPVARRSAPGRARA